MRVTRARVLWICVALFCAIGILFCLWRQYQLRQEQRQVAFFILSDLITGENPTSNSINYTYELKDNKTLIMLDDIIYAQSGLDAITTDKVAFTSVSEGQKQNLSGETYDTPKLYVAFDFLATWTGGEMKMFHVVVVAHGVYYYQVLKVGNELFKVSGEYDFAIRRIPW